MNTIFIFFTSSLLFLTDQSSKIDKSALYDPCLNNLKKSIVWKLAEIDPNVSSVREFSHAAKFEIEITG